MAKSKFVKVEVFLTQENAKILNNVDEIMGTKHSYVNAAIEATASMKKFKDMRNDEVKSSQKENAKEDNSQAANDNPGAE